MLFRLLVVFAHHRCKTLVMKN